MSTIGERIRNARLREGLSVPDLAERVGKGCSVDTIRRLERIGRDGRPDEPPKGSRYFDRVLLVLGLNLAQREASEVNSDDPPISLASKAQLVTALARLIYAEADQHEQGNVEPFTIKGMPLRGDDSDSRDIEES